MGAMFTDFFFLMKSTYVGGTSRISYICEVHPPPPARPGCRGTQIIPISSMNGMHRYENFATNYEKRHLCERENLSWNTRVKGHHAGAPSARVPKGLPTLSP